MSAADSKMATLEFQPPTFQCKGVPVHVKQTHLISCLLLDQVAIYSELNENSGFITYR